MISIIILLIVFLLIIVRKVGNVKFEIWEVMVLGAASALITQQITLYDSFKAINFDVILFLFGMFVIGQALEESGYLSHLIYKWFRNARSVDLLVLYILFGTGIASAFLMNDTVAIIGTPIVLLLAGKHKTSPKLLLLALAFAVTIGSAMSPIGNPQNLLIAIHGSIRNPFVSFLKHLFLPTIINLFLTYIILKIFYKGEFHSNSLNHTQEPIKDNRLAKLTKLSLILIIFLILLKVILVFLKIDFGLTYISLISCLPILLFSKRSTELIRKIDWRTLIFFAAMFVLMQSVWNSEFFQNIIESLNLNIASIWMIFLISILLSQLVSNVPLVALYLPMLIHAGATAREMIALAAGSTIAGNLFILGAASNVIIIQNAEKRASITLTFWEFARVGIPVTVVNVLVFWLFFSL